MPTPEDLAREKIDQLLIAAGWAVQDYRAYNPSASRGVAEVERRLSVIDELETLATANLTHATRLRQSILRKSFGGEFLYD
jgi:hypothetical protein